MKKVYIYIFLIITITFNFSCEELDEASLVDSPEIVSIAYGTSFGECQGYCDKRIEIKGTELNFKAAGWYNGTKLPDINLTSTLELEEWEKLINKIDFVIFRNLEEVIGCPDCTDGGAEWIEITTNNLIHRVTFEFNNKPEEVQDYIDELINIMAEFEVNSN